MEFSVYFVCSEYEIRTFTQYNSGNPTTHTEQTDERAKAVMVCLLAGANSKIGGYRVDGENAHLFNISSLTINDDSVVLSWASGGTFPSGGGTLAMMIVY